MTDSNVLDYTTKADDRLLKANVQAHVNQAKMHLEAAADIMALIKNPFIRADAEKLLNFVTEK